MHRLRCMNNNYSERAITAGTYWRLTKSGYIYMTNTPAEIRDYTQFINKASGNVLIEGRLCNVKIPERLCDKYNALGTEWLPAKIVGVINEAGTNYPAVVVNVRKSEKYMNDAIHELRLEPSEVETHLMYRH